MKKEHNSESGASVGNKLTEDKTTTDAPVVVFNGKWFETPDGRRFNTRLKAERHLKNSTEIDGNRPESRGIEP